MAAMAVTFLRRAGATGLLLGALAPCAQAQTQTGTQPRQEAQPACAREACVDAILEAARTGRLADEIALLRQLRRSIITTGTGAPGQAPGQSAPPGPMVPPSLPETFGIGDPDGLSGALAGSADAPDDFPDAARARALGKLKDGQADAARGLVEEALSRDPVYAPYWTDLALVFARQGEHERAVSALLVADTWAFDRMALRRTYREAAGQTRESGLGQDFALALEAIAAIEAEQAHADAALPRPTAGAVRKPAVVEFRSCNKPVYPRASLRRGETGAVTVAFLVGVDGRVERFRKTRSSGHPLLDASAEFSLAVCRFRPATVDGNPIPSWQPVQYVWTLEGTAPPAQQNVLQQPAR
jgi:TonB family protein